MENEGSEVPESRVGDFVAPFEEEGDQVPFHEASDPVVGVCQSWQAQRARSGETERAMLRSGQRT